MAESSIKETVTLMAVGDIMLGDGPACSGHGVGSIIRKNGALSLFMGVEPVIKRGDIAFGNLESVISNRGIDPEKLKSFSMRAHPDSLKALSRAGFNIVSIANNHMLDYGVEGLKETIEHLSANNIDYTGSVDTTGQGQQPRILVAKGMTIAFLAYCLVPDKTAFTSSADSEKICTDINNARQTADFVIISLHWGNEFIEIPSPDQTRFAHRLIDSGAGLILGHHPHILQGLEEYKGGLIAYSLGDFVFDVNYIEELRNSVILEYRFSKSGLIDYELHPVYIDRHYHPLLLEGIKKTKALHKIEQLSLSLKEAAGYEKKKYRNLVNARGRSVKRRMILYFLRNIYRYEWRYTRNTIIEYLKRRLR